MKDTEQDPDIRAAYERLTGALAPPADGPARVERRVAVRRRRRRATAGGAALTLAAVVGAFALGSGDEPVRAVDPAVDPGPVSTLTTTLPDGTPYTFADVDVTCEGGLITAETPFRTVGEGPEEGLAQPFLLIQGQVAKLPAGRVLRLPVDGPGGSDTYPIVLFFALAGDRDANELSSAVGDASGTVEVLEASCGTEPRLALRVDAVLGSEVGQPAMSLTGELR
ncbi:hypothetical protein [Nocardioides sp. SYSU DS0663]|uniref:hypothetical protein n=1 Tax=Nocardioides sp. SYSU DS0663 TaxID=3416445 RepID=UPI003F4C9B36